MSITKTKKQVEVLVENELTLANSKNPQFHSEWEGYGVLLSEVDEMEIEVEMVMKKFGLVFENIQNRQNKEIIVKDLKSLKESAILSVSEMVQVAAMAQKFIDFMEKNK